MDYMPNTQTPNIPPRKDSPNLAFISLIIGIFSIISCFLGLSFFVGSFGLILALLSRGGNSNFSNTAIVGIITNLLGFLFGVLLFAIIIWGIYHFGGVEQFSDVLEKYSHLSTTYQ